MADYDIPGFGPDDIETGAGEIIHCVSAGAGPAILLLHGHPQTHATWHRIAPRFVDAGFTVVATDLRGYGDSSKPAGGERHVNYSKRAMARDQVDVMRALGHQSFSVVGHDRGGQGHRRHAFLTGRGIGRR